MATKAPHGGQRKSAGRKKPTAPLDVHSVRLKAEQAEKARAIGAGDLSAGIRALIDGRHEHHGHAFAISQSAEGFTVDFPDFPAIITSGKTPAEAVQNAREALELHLESMERQSDGNGH